jgi:tetratricopeptide (TPR) repeat protein
MSPTKELVFLSYAHEDIGQLRKIHEGLKKRKVNAWIDIENLKKDEELRRSIERTIAHSKSYVFCLSNAALKNTSLEAPGFLDIELHTAWTFAKERDAKDFQFVVARIEDCDRGDNRLNRQSQIDLFPDLEKGLDILASALRGRSLSEPIAKGEITEDEKIIESIMGKATMFYYSGDYDKSLLTFDIATDTKPDYADAWNNKGVALFKLGRLEEALQTYNKAIAIKPVLHEAWYNKGVTLAALDRREEALEAYNKAIEIKPDDAEAWANKGAALDALGRLDEALKAYNKAIAIKPDLHEAWYNKGFTLAALGRREEALQAYNKAIAIKPDYHEAWYNKGNVLDDLGRREEALQAINKAIEIKPDLHQAWSNKGIVLNDLGRHKEALEAFAESKRLENQKK